MIITPECISQWAENFLKDTRLDACSPEETQAYKNVMLEIIHEVGDIISKGPSHAILHCDVSISLALHASDSHYPNVDIAVKTKYNDGDCIEVGAIPDTGVDDLILEEFRLDQVKESCNRFREFFHTYLGK